MIHRLVVQPRGELPPEVLARVCARQEGLCNSCGAVLHRGKRMVHLDHIKPISDNGGSGDLDNIQALCCYCHNAKSAEEEAAQAALQGMSGPFRGLASQFSPELYY